MTNRGYSKVIIEGTVGREPEIRQHPYPRHLRKDLCNNI